jgi:rhodanese-related sulfurtransferase
VIVDSGVGTDVTFQECQKLKELGFKNVSVLEGGLRSWNSAGGTLEGIGIQGASLATITAADFYLAKSNPGWFVFILASPQKTEALSWSSSTTIQIAKSTSWNSQTQEAFQQALSKNKEASNILILTSEGKELDPIEKTLRKIKATSRVYYLEGGLRAYAHWNDLQSHIENHRTVTLAEDVSAPLGKPRITRKGCGSCP